jgi:hypothetical protein
MTAVVLVQRLKEAGMTWEEMVELFIVLRRMTESEASRLMFQAITGEQESKPA